MTYCVIIEVMNLLLKLSCLLLIWSGVFDIETTMWELYRDTPRVLALVWCIQEWADIIRR